MICVVVNRHLGPDEIDEIRDLRGKGNYKFLFMKDLNVELRSMGFTKFELSAEKKAEIYYSILKIIVDFGGKIVKDKSVNDWLSFDKADLWYYQRFRTYFYLRELAYERAVIEKLAPEYEKIITFTGNNDLLNDLDFLEIKKGKDDKSKKPDYLSYINYFLLVVIRSVLSFSKINRLRKIKHIVLDHAIRQTCLDINTMKIVKDNYVLSYLYDKLDSEFVILDYAQMPRIFTGDKFRILRTHFFTAHKNKLRFYGEHILLRAILSSKIRKKLKEISAKLFDIYSVIENSDLSAEENIIMSHYRALHKSTMLYVLKYFAYDRFFSKFTFKTISGIDENSPGVKSILDAAKKNSIKTIGIQHGSISDFSIAYMYSKQDQEKNAMADYTLVWGERWKDILIKKSNFNEDSIKITGQIRTDIIPKLQSVNKQSIIRNIEPGKNLIVFASQPQPDAKLRRQAAVDVFSAVRDMENVFLVVKLHPGEIHDTDYYHLLAKESRCLNYKLMLDIDLFLLLSACDILITCYSTVGTETIYFNKPLIVHNPLNLDMQSYYKEGVAFQAINESEVKDYIEKILSSELKINQEAYDRFISGYAYKIDGKASERCLKFIKSLG